MKTRKSYCVQGLFYAFSGVALFALFAYRATLNQSAEFVVGVVFLLGFIYQSYSCFAVEKEV